MARIPDPDLPIYKSLFHHTMVDKKYRKTNLTNDRKKKLFTIQLLLSYDNN